MDRAEEVRVLRQMALNVGKSYKQDAETQEVAGFLAMAGNDYRNELLIFGRAVNGWGEDPQHLAALADENKAKTFSEVALKDACRENGECPMLWVTELAGEDLNDDGTSRYNTNRSAFWRVIKATLGRLNIADTTGERWPSSIVWSNLYKIAPVGGGNPSSRLCNAQLEDCTKLFSIEMDSFAPKRVIFATGLDWAEPFLVNNGVTFSKGDGSNYVEAFGKIILRDGQVCRFVVAPHPQGKNENEWVGSVTGHLDSL